MFSRVLGSQGKVQVPAWGALEEQGGPRGHQGVVFWVFSEFFHNLRGFCYGKQDLKVSFRHRSALKGVGVPGVGSGT